MSFDIVAIGASLGGVEALITLLGGLPGDFPAPLVITQHLYPGFSNLAEILNRAAPLPVKWAEHAAPLCPSTVYVAQPGQHLLVNRQERLVLSGHEKVNHSRPSVDVLFQSVAEVFGARAIGVILTGMLFDGAKGTGAIQAAGGEVIVQDPQDAFASGMPKAALKNGSANFMLPLEKIAPTLITMTMVQGAMTVFSGQMPRQCYNWVSPIVSYNHR
jgi:two-component system chemotaxis response regulator CheB